MSATHHLDTRGRRDLAVGVDVGGTNSDAVVLDGTGAVLAAAKAPTSADVTGGIRAAVARVLADLAAQGVDAGRVSRVMLGTTHATNAIVSRRDLARVAVLRLGAPAATEHPPLGSWPRDLAATALAGTAMVRGGHMVDGTPIARLDTDAVLRFVDSLAVPGGGRGFDAVAVTGIFSPSYPEQEQEVAALLRAHLGADLEVFLSQDIGPTGLLERENATVLNAALHGVARTVTGALVTVVAELGLDAATYFAQNDGTLMSLDRAVQFPVLTIGSGPANSLRGAAHLSGVADAIVVDVGGTTSDLGVLVKGFPRESTLPREIGGVRTNFRMPDIISVGVGGGTVVDSATGAVGPGSVGYRIESEALLFGGGTATLTDAAFLAGALTGTPLAAARGAASLRGPAPAVREAMTAALATAHQRVEGAAERLSLGRLDMPLVVVGGGGFLVPDALHGASRVVRPGHGDVANAVGAAISLAGGRADQIGDADDREAAIAEASRAAVAKAIHAGADPLRVEVVDVTETSISYSTRPAVRVSVKAAGPLARLEAMAAAPS